MDVNQALNFWGLSPPIDLIGLHEAGSSAAYPDASAASEAPQKAEELRVLQVSPSDCRHTALTIARAARHAKTNVLMYVFQTHMEELARHLLLVSIFLDEEQTMRDRVETFLEVFGNTKLRDKTAAYLTDRSKLLADIVLGDGHKSGAGTPQEFSRLSALFDFSLMKYKERDDLVDVIRSWNQNVPFDMEGQWDSRMRKFYGDRYDARKNMFDWDYQMRLVQAGADIVHWYHFRDWRSTGVAFEFRDATYPAPNLSLSGYARGSLVAFRDRNGTERGTRVLKRGYWGDIVNSPYACFGVSAEAGPDRDALFKMMNKQHVKTAVDVSVYNGAIHELETATRYALPAEEAKEMAEQPGKAVIDAIAEDDEEGEAEAEAASRDGAAAGSGEASGSTGGEASGSGTSAEEAAAAEAVAAAKAKAAASARAGEVISRFKICFLTGEVESAVCKNKKLAGKMDVITVGNYQTQSVANGLGRTAKQSCVLALESAKYHLGVDKDGQKRFVERATELAQGAGWAALSVGEEVADGSHLVFRYTGAPPAAPATPAPAGSGGGGGAEGAAAAAAEAAGEGAGLLVAAAERSAKAPEDAEVAAAEAAASSAAAAGELAAEAAAP